MKSLGPSVGKHVFVGYCESLIPDHEYPPLFCSFVDDSFACFLDQRSLLELLSLSLVVYILLCNSLTRVNRIIMSCCFLEYRVEHIFDGGQFHDVCVLQANVRQQHAHRQWSFAVYCAQNDNESQDENARNQGAVLYHNYIVRLPARNL